MTNSDDQRLTPYSFLRVFADDGTIDAAELALLEKLALQDRQIDVEERDVLANIFARVTPEQVDPSLWLEIEEFKARVGIP